MRYKTPWRETPRGTFLQVEFGERDLGQGPYVSVTAVESRAKSDKDRFVISCGCMHDAIAETFPEIRPLIPFHLGYSGIPMHYQANAAYWRDMEIGLIPWRTYDPDPRKALHEHILADVDGLDVDALLDLMLTRFQLRLALRVPALRVAFDNIDIPAIAAAVQAQKIG